MRVGMVALLLLLSSCAFPQPGLKSASDGIPSVRPVDPQEGAPTPFVPGSGNVAFVTEMTPREPCVGEPVRLAGSKFLGAKRVTAWLKGDTPEKAIIVCCYPLDHVPYAVKVGEAAVDAQGAFEMTFTLQSQMAPVSTGGQILVEPGKGYNIVLVDDAPGGGNRGVGFMMASGCAGTSPPVAKPASIRIEPAFPCHGEPVTVIGEGFQGPQQPLEFHLAETRFGDGPSKTVEAPVSGDGSIRYSFKLDDMLEVRAGSRYFLYAFDARNNRKLTVPIPVCNPQLKVALEARSIPLEGGLQGRIDLRTGESPQPRLEDENESAVIRSQRELEAFGDRHHLTPETLAQFPKLDFTREMGLMVLSGQRYGTELLEITAVERREEGLQVHAVVWRSPSPLLGPYVSFHYLPIPRTDEPIRFAPLAFGFLDQRDLLAPQRSGRKYPILEGAIDRPPFVHTF